MAKRPFGVSTHLYHGHRLTRDHLLEIAAHGFEALELFATRTHFDYHNPAAVADLQQWLAEAGLELHGVHAPIGESFIGGRWGAPLTLASADPETRAHAWPKPSARCTSRGGFPFSVLVVHLGLPRTQNRRPATTAATARGAASKSCSGWPSRSVCGSRSK